MMHTSDIDDLADLVGKWPGKTDRDVPERRHSAIYHMLDVGAVAEAIAMRLGHPASVISSIALLAALHDIGKISNEFRNMIEGGIRQTNKHWEFSEAWMLANQGLLCRAVGLTNPRAFCTIAAAVAGHHGRPPRLNMDGLEGLLSPNRSGPEAANDAHRVIAAFSRLWPGADLPWRTAGDAQVASFYLSGLISVADWIGSNPGWFAMREDPIPLADYLDQARCRASVALKESRYLSGVPRRTADPLFGFALRPMQVAVAGAALPEGPTLAVVEDETGSGKTEAALMLADRLMRAGKGDGVYFALPTMATANAMFGRVATVMPRLLEGRPSLALAHGKAGLHEGFSRMVGGPDRDVREATEASCSEWLGDDRRKALLATVGVGTIDQALMGILPTRFLTMRLFGLARKVLVVDEAHDYDPYVARELEALLEAHAALGGSAIVMTATLPLGMRDRYLSAWRRGTGATDAAGIEDKAYPALHIAGVSAPFTSTPVAPAPEVPGQERWPVRAARIASDSDAVRLIAEASRSGAACAWIRNSVDDAIAAVAALESAGIEADLAHARFCAADRNAIEDRLLGRFGKDGTDRSGRVLVGTQVLEQSIDVDFDVMVSDLAPIGALVQRMGRLWRHMSVRPRRARPTGERILHVLSPDPDRVECGRWIGQVLGKGAYVYDQDDLWRTASTLFGHGSIASPSELRDLIEQVHGAAVIGLPGPLRDAEVKAAGRRGAERSHGQRNVIEIRKGYRAIKGVWSDEIFPTRLGDEIATLVLARSDGGTLTPWASDPDPRRAWAMSEVGVAARRLVGVTLPDQARPDISALRQGWPTSRREAMLRYDGGKVPGTAICPVGNDGRICDILSYDTRHGLTFSPRV